MLSDRERTMLQELERQFWVEDPRFAQTFEARAQRLQRWPVEISTMAIASAALVLGSFMLLVGSLAGALAVAGVTVLIGVVWRCTDTTRGRRPTDRPYPQQNEF